MKPPIEPTSEQCSANAELDIGEPGWRAFACWYPQMGGYVAHAVVAWFPHEPRKDMPSHLELPCFEVWVWHDGEFPFSDEESRQPAHLHHCAASQFIAFGELVEERQRAATSGGAG